MTPGRGTIWNLHSETENWVHDIWLQTNLVAGYTRIIAKTIILLLNYYFNITIINEHFQLVNTKIIILDLINHIMIILMKKA